MRASTESENIQGAGPATAGLGAAAKQCCGLEFRVLLHVSVALMGPFVAAMSLGFTSPALGTMLGEKIDGVEVPPELSVFANDPGLGSWFSALVNIGALLGAAVGGWFGQHVGWQPSLRLAALLMVSGWVWIVAISSPLQLCVARLVIGLGVGLQSVVVPRLIADSSPKRIRGALGTLTAASILVGAMVVQMLGGTVFRAGTGRRFCAWRELGGCVAFVGLALLMASFTLLYVPLSGAAAASVGTNSILEAGAERFVPGTNSMRGGGSLCRQFLDHWRIVLAGVVPMVWQQLSGINAVIFFGQRLLEEAGVRSYAVLGVTVLAVQCLGVLIAFVLVERLGRRPLLIASSFGMAVGAGALGFCFAIKSPQLAVLSIYIYVLSFAIGLGPVPWLLLPELCLPSDLRQIVSSLATATNWGCSFAVTGPPLNAVERAFGLGGVFALLSCVCLVGGALVVALVPETKPARSTSDTLRCWGHECSDHPSAREVHVVLPPASLETQPRNG